MFKSYENLDTLLEALENRECPDLMEPAQKLLGDRKFERDDGTIWRAVESAVRDSKLSASGSVEISEGKAC